MALITKTRRVKQLEDGGGGSGRPPCDYCGWGGDNGEPDEPEDGDSFEIVFDGDAQDEWCEACGRQTERAIYFDDNAPWSEGE